MTIKQLRTVELTKAEKSFIKTYRRKDYHYFREIQQYTQLLEKLTKL